MGRWLGSGCFRLIGGLLGSGQAAPHGVLGRQIKGGEEQRFEISFADLFISGVPEIANLLRIPQ